MPTLLIQPATAQDTETLLELGKRTFRQTYLETSDAAELDQYVASNFTFERVSAQLIAPDSFFFLGLQNTQAVGYLHLRIAPPPACVSGSLPIELSRIYLDRAAQGGGSGSQLMQFALDESRRRNRKTIWLGVYAENAKAREFYRRWEFEDVGTHAFNFGGTIYHDPVMSRRL